MMSTYLIFINEEWHLFVLDYWKLKGWPYIIFFVIILIVCQLFIMKMFTALLINHFCRSKIILKQSQEDKYFYPKFWKKKFRELINKMKPYFLKYFNKLYSVFASYIKNEKNDVNISIDFCFINLLYIKKIRVVSKQTDNLKKSIIASKMKHLNSRKSVKIVEARNTITNVDDMNEEIIVHKDIEAMFKKEDISTTPIDSRRNFKNLTKLDSELINKVKQNEDLMREQTHILIENEEIKNIQNDTSPNFANSKIISAKKNEIIDKVGLVFDSFNDSSCHIKKTKTMKIVSGKDTPLKMGGSEKQLPPTVFQQNTPKTNKSNSRANTILQFSSILDSNNDLRSEINTAKIIKENQGFFIVFHYYINILNVLKENLCIYLEKKIKSESYVKKYSKTFLFNFSSWVWLLVLA